MLDIGGRRKPIFATLEIPEEMSENKPEIMLWRNVLDFAFYDAFMEGGSQETVELREEALEFWENDRENLESVCDLACLEVGVVLDMYNRAKEKYYNG